MCNDKNKNSGRVSCSACKAFIIEGVSGFVVKPASAWHNIGVTIEVKFITC